MGPLATSAPPDVLVAVNMEKLRSFIVEKGGTLTGAWECVVKMRTNGKSAGACDVYYISPGGKRFRSRAEVAVDLGLIEDTKQKAAGPAGERKRKQRDSSSGGGQRQGKFSRLSALSSGLGRAGARASGASVEMLMNKRAVAKPDGSKERCEQACQVDRYQLEHSAELWLRYLQQQQRTQQVAMQGAVGSAAAASQRPKGAPACSTAPSTSAPAAVSSQDRPLQDKEEEQKPSKLRLVSSSGAPPNSSAGAPATAGAPAQGGASEGPGDEKQHAPRPRKSAPAAGILPSTPTGIATTAASSPMVAAQ